MNSALADLLDVSKDPYAWLAAYKKRSPTKIIGLFPMYLPAELIHAAGMLPVTIWEGNEPTTVVDAHVPPANCAIVRTFVDDWLRGRLDFFDGIVLYDTCLQARSLPFILDLNKRPAYFEVICHHGWLPDLVREQHQSYLMSNLEYLKGTLEQLGGQKITDDAIRESILVFNKNRSLLRRLYELRRQNPGIIKASEVVGVVQAGMLMPKEEHNRLLETLLSDLEKKPVVAQDTVRVIGVGSLCLAVPAGVLDLVEQMGATIVDDDLYVGSKTIINDVDPTGNPLDALADRYFKKTPPCPTKVDWEGDWSDYILELVRKNDAAGVLTFMVKYCPPLMAYYPDIKRKLTMSGVPELLIEFEHLGMQEDQLKTRIQAFLEVARGNR